MDPPYSHHAFSRLQSQQPTPESRYGPIPPSPFASQPAAQRSETLHKNDPFLRRRNDLDERRRSPSMTNEHQSYMLPHASRYTSCSTSVPHDGTTAGTRPRQNSFGAGGLWGDGSGDRLALHRTEEPRDRSIPQPLPSTPLPPALGTSQQGRPGQEDVQRRLTGQASSASLYSSTTSDHHPPPLFSGLQMLPPSPHPVQAQSHPQTAPARTTASSSFSNGRDLPAPSSVHRPSSSMSISSMLDSNPSKPSREYVSNGNGAAPSSIMAGPSKSPTRQAGQATSPPRLNQGNPLLAERPSSPEKYKGYQPQIVRPFRSYSGGLGQRPPSFAQPASRGAALIGLASGVQTSQHSPTSGIGVHRLWQTQEGKRLPDGVLVNRPSSQPTGLRSPPRHKDGRPILGNTDPVDYNQDTKPVRIESEQERNLEEQKTSVSDPPDRERFVQSTYPMSRPSGSHDGDQLNPEQERSAGLDYSFLSRPARNSNPHPSQRNEAMPPRANQILDRDPQPSNSAQSPFSPDKLRRLQKERHVLHQRNMAHSPSKLAPSSTGDDERQALAITESSMSCPDSVEIPKDGDINNQHHSREDLNGHRKSSLVMLMENSRRGGRFSPLPQAVQGVQGRTSGPASDPGIKNEFARMFSGIGSGAGSAGPTGSGTSTPFAPPSPTMSHEQRPTPFNPGGDQVPGKPTAPSRGGKRSRKVRDDEPKAEPIDGEVSNGKAQKKSRQNHKHPYHLHHRHHYHADEADRGNGVTTPTAINGRRVNTPAQATSSTAPHRHHHHTPHHHRHHEPRPPRMPTITINNEPLLNAVSHLPRVHLGSTAYSSSIEPASSATADASKPGYLTTADPLPRYEGKENSTYTIRVPRFYLGPQEREKICRRRALWGTDVYTDDSDPLAAAIHSGWIRGEYGEDVDPSMLELPGTAKDENASAGTLSTDAQGIITTQPAEPMLPPRGKDLHLTMLVLPPLEKYASHIFHGIKSRPWSNTHDGMSFKILSMEWVDEARAERSGKARRERMKTVQGQSSSAGPAVRPYKGALGLRGGGASQGATVAVGA